MTSVLVVARSPVTRAGLASLVGADGRFEVTGSVGGAMEVAQALEAVPPDVVLIELDEASENELAELLSTTEAGTESTAPAFVVLGADSEVEWVARALRSGARAVLPRHASGEEIVAAIEAAAAGLVVVHRDAIEALEEALNVTEEAAPALPPGVSEDRLAEPLTGREREVLGMMAEGLGNKEIAWRLKISEHTVKFHASSIFAKLGVASRTEAVTEGLRRGLIML